VFGVISRSALFPDTPEPPSSKTSGIGVCARVGGVGAYVETSQALAVGIEGRVVVRDELCCRGRANMCQNRCSPASGGVLPIRSSKGQIGVRLERALTRDALEIDFRHVSKTRSLS
jgi:hypothetical protein